jgi:hypothetical protein
MPVNVPFIMPPLSERCVSALSPERVYLTRHDQKVSTAIIEGTRTMGEAIGQDRVGHMLSTRFTFTQAYRPITRQTKRSWCNLYPRQ